MGFLPYLAGNLNELRHLGKSMVSISQSSLPLREGYIILYSKSSAKVFKLHSGKRLVENICSLVICQNILELDHTFLHHIMYEVIPSLCVLQLVMKYRIQWHLHITLVITVNHDWLWNLAKQSCKNFTKPNYFLGCWTSNHILSLCTTESYWVLIPTTPGNNYRT